MENINLIRKIVWSFHKSTKIDWDDLFQEASLAYLEALRTYNPERGKITTHAWTTISNALKTYAEHERRVAPLSVDLQEARHVSLNYQWLWENIPAESYDVVEAILDHPERFIGLDPKEARVQLRILLNQEGFTLDVARRAIRALKEVFA